MKIQPQLLFPTVSSGPIYPRISRPSLKPLETLPPPATKKRFEEIANQEALRYTQKTPLAEGPNAMIYHALDTQLHRSVALKCFRPEALSSKTTRQLSHLTAVARVAHDHVVSTYDLGENKSGPFIVMEHLLGQTLEASLEKRALGFQRFLQFARQSLEGLLAIHDAGVLHLGLKPANLMMVADPRSNGESVKIIGFSRAQIIAQERDNLANALGRNSDIRCVAPEQLICGTVNEKTDLYSLGCCFYRALTKRTPFDGDNVMHIMAAHMHHFVKPLCQQRPDLPTWLQDWVMSLIAREPTDRPTVAEALQTLLRAAHERHHLQAFA